MTKQELQKELSKLIKERDRYLKGFIKYIDLVNPRGKTQKEIFDEAYYNFKKASEKDKKRAFFELVSGQGSFLPPIGKHNQGKLFTK